MQTAPKTDPAPLQAISLINATAHGSVLSSKTPLSFWGGIDPLTGKVIDQHHPLMGNCIAGKVLVLPCSRGSCSGSGVILELLLNGNAPAALVLENEEEVLTVGVIVAREVFGVAIPIVRLEDKDFQTVLRAKWVAIHGSFVQVLSGPTLERDLISSGSGCSSVLQMEQERKLPLNFIMSDLDLENLKGTHGKATQVAARIILQFAMIQGATEMIDVSRAHIDGCVYTGPATLRFAEQLCVWGAQVRIPTTLNSISVDRLRWRVQGVDPAIGDPAIQLADAYIRMGAQPTYTCAPYLLDNNPRKGEQIIWAESNAVVYANSVLGARTVKCPDYLDICVALTGRAPNVGCHITANRQARIKIAVPVFECADDSLFPLLGHVIGEIAANQICVVTGLENTLVSDNDLKAFGAAFATTSSAPMFHLAGITPEAKSEEDQAAYTSLATSIQVKRSDLIDKWKQLNSGPSTKIDLVSLGNPHFSYDEIVKCAELCRGRTKVASVKVVLTCGRDVYASVCQHASLVSDLDAFGVEIITDTCWCMITTPIIPPTARTIMTNSGKFAHYGAGLTGCQMRFGSLAQCLDAACTGRASLNPPSWLYCATASWL